MRRSYPAELPKYQAAAWGAQRTDGAGEATVAVCPCLSLTLENALLESVSFVDAINLMGVPLTFSLHGGARLTMILVQDRRFARRRLQSPAFMNCGGYLCICKWTPMNSLGPSGMAGPFKTLLGRGIRDVA